MKSENKVQGEVGAVVHAIRILRHLAATTTPLGVAAIARETGINPSTCFNILRTLARARFVAFRDGDKTYTLGMAVAELATGLVGLRHAELIRPELERLALNYDMLLVLWRISEDGHIALIDRAHSETAVRVEMRLGLRLPALVGAVGRCVAAALDLPVAELRRRFATLRWQNPPTFESYRADIARAGIDGWAIDDGQLYRGLQTVASIVTDETGQPRFGLSGITIADQHGHEILVRLGADLHEVATITSASLYPSVSRIAGMLQS
ncbi:helix-turn-helix domain-containing protein [Acidiphilium sp. AL]|uniref:Helix-turn-helix domain-containing protein n=1 Tax=Acidiphilium iwatense TaxID=768198 RepID=A0ABS9DVC4_9PROT|nr:MULTISPECIES: helix-turn-helix domain-containing protein [Acidiphilium]MCF3945417.1 helix-turn-helix domain-containing protein [Acidiphilium iwatense]MCU4158933.1 helix-turn-helix domain-containing protein [Acidiphilium sp. AL]